MVSIPVRTSSNLFNFPANSYAQLVSHSRLTITITSVVFALVDMCCQTDPGSSEPDNGQPISVGPEKGGNVQPKFSLPRVSQPRGRPRQGKRNKTFNRKRDRPKTGKRRPPGSVLKVTASKKAATVPLSSVPVVQAKSSAFLQNDDSRAATPITPIAVERVEVSPHKVMLMLVDGNVSFLNVPANK